LCGSCSRYGGSPDGRSPPASAPFGAAVFAFVAHSATRGQRDFSSVRGLAATRYDLIVREGTVDKGPHDAPHRRPSPDQSEQPQDPAVSAALR
jgi:hypothetical protein